MTRKNQDNSVAGKARKAGIPKGTVYARLNNGWSLKKALSVPVKQKHRAKKKVVEKTEVEVKKVNTPKPPVPKNNPIVVEKYASKKPTKLVVWGLVAVSIMLILITTGV